MVHGREPLGVRCQNKKVVKRKPRPQWDSSINDVSSMKLSKTEQEKRTKLYSAKHMEKIRNEIKTMQRKEKSVQNAIHSSPFVAHNRSIVYQETTDTRTKLQELLNETDRKMSEAKDLFGDHSYKYRVIPNVTSAPSFKHSPYTLTRSMTEANPSSPPTALNDTQKLGVVTVETLPPDNSRVDLDRIRELLNQEKENCLLTAQNTLLNSTTLNVTGAAVKINKVLDFNEDIPSVIMGDRSRRRVRISDSDRDIAVPAAESASEVQDSSIWSSVPVEVKQVVMSTKPEKRDSSFSESSPPRLRESSSESLVSPSRIKKQQSAEKKKSPGKDEKKRSPEKEDSPVRVVSKSTHPPRRQAPSQTTPPGKAGTALGKTGTSPGKAGSASGKVGTSPGNEGELPLGNSVSEHHYPRILKIPAIKESLELESLPDQGAEEDVDPVRESRNPSGRKGSPRNKLVHAATSPVPSPRDKQTTSIATSPVPGLLSPVKKEAGLETKRETYDRHYTDQELRDRLENLIVGGHYPFAKVVQKSYAIADTEGREEGQDTGKQAGAWIRANFANEGENLTFVDSSPLKGAALDLELKLRKYQSQIGVKPNKNNTPVGGFSGYTSLLLSSVSTMIGYLTEQENNTLDERNMRVEVIETMSALQNTVEALSTELLACRKDLSETKQRIQTMEQDYSSTLMFLIDNCVLKDPALQTPLAAQRVKQLPTVISPFTTTPPAPAPTTTPPQPTNTTAPDLMTFTPHPTRSGDLMEFTPGQPDQTGSLVQITPETSEQYLQYLEEKTEALRSGLDAKISSLSKSGNENEVGVVADTLEVRPEEKSTLSAANKSNLSSLNFSALTDDGLDLSQDLDALIDRLKEMNAQTLAVTSKQMGLTPRKADANVDKSLDNIKDMLKVEDTKPIEAATRVIDSYERKSDFSPSQLLPDFQETPVNRDVKLSNSSAEISTLSLPTAEISSIVQPSPDIAHSSGRISGEYIGGFTGTKPAAERPVTPNPLSPRRVQEEIKRSTTDQTNAVSPPQETLSVTTTTPETSSKRLQVPSPESDSNRPSSAFSPPTKEHQLSTEDISQSSPKQDKTALINDFLSHNPHYLKKISESLTSASLPSFPTSPTLVSTAWVSQDDGLPNNSTSLESVDKSPVVKSSSSNSGLADAVVRGSVTKNIAKFEKRREEAELELERERSISPKRSLSRSPSRRGKVPVRSALSPERKARSPDRKIKHRVSWGEDLVAEEPSSPENEVFENHTKSPKEAELAAEESEIVMKPDRSQLPPRRNAEKTKNDRRGKVANGRENSVISTNERVVAEKNVEKRQVPEKKNLANGSVTKNGAINGQKVKQREGNSQLEKIVETPSVEKPSLTTDSRGSDLMTRLMNMNDAKLTELVTTLNKLTER